MEISLSPAPIGATTADTPLAPQPRVDARPVFQRTLKSEICISGIGLHTGKSVTLKLIPAPADHGIEFFRSDLINGARTIKLSAMGVTDTRMCTLLSNDHGGTIGTIEHLMAALHTCGLTNLRIELNGPEIPILDGSSSIFMQLIAEAGICDLDAKQTYLRILRPVEVTSKGRKARFAPHVCADDTRLTFDFGIDFDAACIGRQSYDFTLTQQGFETHIGAARTFGFSHDLDAMRARGLAKGASMDNAILVDAGRVANPDGLRFENEFVRHKVLDAIGDVFIEGAPVIGAYMGSRAGHEMTNLLMRKLMSDPQNYQWVTI